MRYTITLEYQGKQYSFLDDFVDDEQIVRMYTEGNFACDCNRSDFLRQHCGLDFKDDPLADLEEYRETAEWTLKCGYTISLISIQSGERVVWPGTSLAKRMALEQERAKAQIEEVLQYNRAHPEQCVRFEDYLSPAKAAQSGQLRLSDLDELIERVHRAFWPEKEHQG